MAVDRDGGRNVAIQITVPSSSREPRPRIAASERQRPQSRADAAKNSADGTARRRARRRRRARYEPFAFLGRAAAFTSSALGLLALGDAVLRQVERRALGRTTPRTARRDPRGERRQPRGEDAGIEPRELAVALARARPPLDEEPTLICPSGSRRPTVAQRRLAPRLAPPGARRPPCQREDWYPATRGHGRQRQQHRGTTRGDAWPGRSSLRRSCCARPSTSQKQPRRAVDLAARVHRPAHAPSRPGRSPPLPLCKVCRANRSAAA